MTHQNRYLFGTVFLTGAAVLVLEVTAVRILTPFYGSSLYVFSSVLTVILAALALGYWYGGKRADKKHSIDELYLIIASSGVVVLFLLICAEVILPVFAPAFSIQLGPLLFSILLFFTPGFLLGIVSPYIIKLQSLSTPQEHIGSVVGATFFWGTIGSILGSIATGFWLIPVLGVQGTILLVSIVLVAVGLVVPLFLDRPLSTRAFVLVLGIVVILAIIAYDIEKQQDEQYIYSRDGIYSSIRINDFTYNDKPARIMRRDTNNSSAIFLDSTELVFPYTHFSLLYDELVPDAENFLLLGGGAYTIPRALHTRNPELNIDVVEIEPVLYYLSLKYFDLSKTSKITNHTEDGRVFLSRNEQKYDVIFADAFGTDIAVPFHLTTKEFYELVSERLADDGVLIMNFIGKVRTPRPSLFGSVTKTVTSVFPNTLIFPIEFTNLTRIQNVMFISRKSDLPINVGDATVTYYDGTPIAVTDMELPRSRIDLSREILLTDNHAPVEYLLVKQK